MNRSDYPVSVVPNLIELTSNARGNTVDENTAWDSKWLRPNMSVIEKTGHEKTGHEKTAHENTRHEKTRIEKPQERKIELLEEEDSPSLALRFLRWLFPDVNQRRALRYPTPGLVAYYWTGGAPHSYHVGDMSATGLFLLTSERWAPGTLIQMTLQQQDGKAHNAQNSICVLSEVVRWDDNGAGFNFILTDYENVLDYGLMPAEAVDRKAVEHFLRKIGAPISR